MLPLYEMLHALLYIWQNEVDRESGKDRPPTPPEPLPVKNEDEGGDSRSVSGSSRHSDDEVNTVCTFIAS